MKFQSLFLFLLIGFVSCQSGDQQKAQEKPAGESYPALPNNFVNDLYQKTIAVDVIAYNMGVSMSYNDQASVQSVLRFITPETIEIDPKCKTVGRISFMTENGIGEEAELYIHDGCRSLVWIKDNKKVYSNLLSLEGRDFMNQFMPENPEDIRVPNNAKTK